MKQEVRKDMFVDRRQNKDRRRDESGLPDNQCRRRRSDRRQSPGYYDRHWWLHANYVDSEIFL